MNTQELKEYIGRVLGNNIRCLLPSYWWKRLFGLVVDKVDEVEGRVLEVPELITSSLAEFAEKYPDIESRTFYLEGSTEKIEKNAALLRKVGEEYQNGIVQHVYLATLFNGETGKLIVTSPQFIVTSGFRFINVATPFFKVLKDVIINEDGTCALEDAEYSVAVDTSKFATTAQLQELDNILSDEIDGLKDSKQNEIEDLAAIRSGAALGATALQNVKTINGNSIEGDGDVSVGSITSVDTGDILDDVDVRYATEQYVDDAIANVDIDTSHLATKTELDAKYTKPSNGIPKSDLSSAVQESLGKADTAIQNVKTINGESILGEGDIVVSVGDIDTSNLATKEELETLSERLGEKQEKLVSGENIKTFNGESVLGGGDIVAGSIVGVETGDNLEDVEMEYATKIYVDNAIAQAIISTINANY